MKPIKTQQRQVKQLLLILSLIYVTISICSSCSDIEREALLSFANCFDHTFMNHFPSWDGKDCCAWNGVGCDNKTGHVVRLDLSQKYLTCTSSKYGEFLLNLKHLNYLDLSNSNDFTGFKISDAIGSLSYLTYLNLSESIFDGNIPSKLGNLSRLNTLDLSDTSLYLADSRWLSQLKSLQLLDLGNLDISDASSMLQELNSLPSLTDLHLDACTFHEFPQSISNINFSSLSVLDLSYTNLNIKVPKWLFMLNNLKYMYLTNTFFKGFIPSEVANLTSLKVLNIAYNSRVRIPSSLRNLCNLEKLDISNSQIGVKLEDLNVSFSGCLMKSLKELFLEFTSLNGNIPDWIGDLSNLQILDLSLNSLYGSIPNSIGGLFSLRYFDLSQNNLNGTISQNLGQLSSINLLDISDNSLVGVLGENHFTKLTKLKFLDITDNHLILNMSSNWKPFTLESLAMGNCVLGPNFPSWLQFQRSLKVLDLSRTRISDSLPNWFWKLTSSISHLDISDNGIRGTIPKVLNFDKKEDLIIDMSSNMFEGNMPNFPPNTKELVLSNNSFSGPLPSNIGNIMHNLSSFSLARNNINGTLPISLCSMTLLTLDISNNNISGELPNCIKQVTSLSYMALVLSNNKFSGRIPEWICSLYQLRSLQLKGNSLSGNLPKCLTNCTNLDILDLGHNMLTGRIPNWLRGLTSLKILSLKSNNFVGEIPDELYNLENLQILDLSSNNLNGSIPKSFGYFRVLTNPQNSLGAGIFTNNGSALTIGFYTETMVLNIIKGEYEYDESLLSEITIVDLSSNNLSGNIPNELTFLIGLQILDLSGNGLTGNVPLQLSNLSQLEALDLSRNKLDGMIPHTLSDMSFLEVLNLSYNNFSGRISTGKQMDTFINPNIYEGNPYLCGFPLYTQCPGDETNENKKPTIQKFEKGSSKEILWVWEMVGSGFVVGLCLVFGVFSFSEKIRAGYFNFVDNLGGWIYVFIMVRYNRLKQNIFKTDQ